MMNPQIPDWKQQKLDARRKATEAMRWWRKAHPEFQNAKVMHHGWYGYCVFAHFRHEWQCVANMKEVFDEFEASKTETGHKTEGTLANFNRYVAGDRI